jgi:threonine/homoserine efflux transporter RhtA
VLSQPLSGVLVLAIAMVIVASVGTTLTSREQTVPPIAD